MASLQEGGIRVFSASSYESLEDKVNQWLLGDSVTTSGREEAYTKKKITQSPSLSVVSGTFYLVLVYEISRS